MKLKVQVRGSGYPILCLHGHPGSAKALTVFTDHLSEHFKTYAPDLRGYGESKTKGNFQMKEHLEDLVELLEEYNIKRCLLLGWSLGGILALELIIKYPERFSGLILVASAARPYGSHPRISFLDLFYTGIAALLNSLKPGWQWNINTFGKRSLFRYLIAQQTPSAYQYLALYAVKAYLQTSIAADKALSAALQSGYSCLTELKNIQVPCLVLAGNEDRHITAASSRETAQNLKNCTFYCYANAAHLFPWEIPAQVLADLDQWLQAYPQVVQYD